MAEKKKKGSKKGKGRGKKYCEKDKTRVKEMLAMGHSIREISDSTKIPESTIRSWKNAILSDDPEELSKVRTEKRTELAGKVWDDAIRAETLLSMRLERAIREEAGLDALMSLVLGASEEELDNETRRNILKQLQSMRFDRPSDIVMVFGTMVDKHAKLIGDEKTKVEVSGTVTRLEDT